MTRIFSLIPAKAGTQCFYEAQVRGIIFNAISVMPIAHRTGSRLSPG